LLRVSALRASINYRGARMTLGSHQRCVGKSQVHLTPKWLIDRLGPFDTDPCAANPRPWDCASLNYSEDARNGLDEPWFGMVWLNPPFDRYQVGFWIRKLAVHGNGICLVHARTEAEWFRPIWLEADAILFLSKRLKFCRPDGTEQPANSGAPPVLAAFGEQAVRRLQGANLGGALIDGHVFLEAMTCDSGSRPTGRDAQQARGEARQSGPKASPKPYHRSYYDNPRIFTYSHS
jgi:hypothetical protein